MRQIWRKIDNITADHRKGVNDMYCHKCGAVLNDRALFCSKCGAKVDKKGTTNEYNYSTYSQYQDNTTYTSHNGEQRYYETGQPTSPTQKKKIGCGTYFSILQIIAVIAVIIWLNTDAGKIALTDMTAYIDGGETYVDMIKTSDIELLDMTYGAFINQLFDNCSWEYFRDNNDDRIVELNCRERTYGSPVCIQFMITPIGNDLYYIEPCYISINGYTINDILSLIYGLV